MGSGSSFISRLGIFVVLAVCGGILLLGTRYVMEQQLNPVFGDYEQELLAARHARLEQAIEGHMDSLVMMARDYGEWNAMYEYASNPADHPEFVADNVYSDSWYHLGIELLLILNADGELLWGQLNDSVGAPLPLDGVVLPLFTDNPLLTSRAGLESHTRGLVETPDGIMMIASTPITRDDGIGPSAGSFMVGSLVNRWRMDQFGRAADAEVTLFRLLDPQLSERVKQVPQELELQTPPFITLQMESEVYILSQLRDLYGESVAVLQATIPTEAIRSGQAAIQRTLAYLGAGIAVFVLLVALVMFYWGGKSEQ